jgi:hypothetical protein
LTNKLSPVNVCTPEFLLPYLLSALTDSSLPDRFAGVAEGEKMALWRLETWRRIDRLAGLGGQLVDLHARGHGEGQGPSFPIKGDNVIEEVRYEPPQPTGHDRHGGRVWINDRQHFEPVPPAAWAHPIGGYQPPNAG